MTLAMIAVERTSSSSSDSGRDGGGGGDGQIVNGDLISVRRAGGSSGTNKTGSGPGQSHAVHHAQELFAKVSSLQEHFVSVSISMLYCIVRNLHGVPDS